MIMVKKVKKKRGDKKACTTKEDNIYICCGSKCFAWDCIKRDWGEGFTETGDGGDSNEEGLEIDFHNEAVRTRAKLGVPNEESDTENLDVCIHQDDDTKHNWWMELPKEKDISVTSSYHCG